MKNIYNRNHPQAVSLQIPEEGHEKQHQKDELGFLQSLRLISDDILKKRHPNERRDLQQKLNIIFSGPPQLAKLFRPRTGKHLVNV